MKRVIIALAAMVLAAAANAQMLFSRSTDIELPQPVADSSATDTVVKPRSISLFLGLQAGVNLYSNMYDDSPYYSTHGLMLQVPLVFNHHLSPRWDVSAGLRYDFCFDPLHYAVKKNWTGNSANGLDFESDSVYGRQFAYAIHNYIGIPLEFTWHPIPNEPRLLKVSFDLFAGYAVGTFVNIGNVVANRNFESNGSYSWSGGGYDEDFSRDDPTFLPWRLELGVSVATDVLGILHGVRLFTDLLPTYRDPITGNSYHRLGMTLYL